MPARHEDDDDRKETFTSTFYSLLLLAFIQTPLKLTQPLDPSIIVQYYHFSSLSQTFFRFRVRMSSNVLYFTGRLGCSLGVVAFIKIYFTSKQPTASLFTPSCISCNCHVCVQSCRRHPGNKKMDRNWHPVQLEQSSGAGGELSAVRIELNVIKFPSFEARFGSIS